MSTLSQEKESNTISSSSEHISIKRRLHRYLTISPKLVRINEWWDFKLPLPVCALFAAAYNGAIAPSALLAPVGMLLSCGFTAGVFASVINDFTDFKQDQDAQKDKVISHVSHRNRIAILTLSIALVALNAFLLLDKTTSLTFYLATVGCFAFYSVKPLRFKERGWLAPITITTGEHLLPILLAFALMTDYCAWNRSWPLLLSLSTIAFCLGARGILWHLLGDREADIAAGVSTVATSDNSDRVLFIGCKVIFPLELSALACLLYASNSSLALWLLGTHAVIELLHYRYFMTNSIVISPAPNHRFVLFEYYQLMLPLAFIFTAGQHQSWYYAWALAFSLLFVRPVYRTTRVILHLLRYRTYPWCRYLLRMRKFKRTYTVEYFEPLATTSQLVDQHSKH